MYRCSFYTLVLMPPPHSPGKQYKLVLIFNPSISHFVVCVSYVFIHPFFLPFLFLSFPRFFTPMFFCTSIVILFADSHSGQSLTFCSSFCHSIVQHTFLAVAGNQPSLPYHQMHFSLIFPTRHFICFDAVDRFLFMKIVLWSSHVPSPLPQATSWWAPTASSATRAPWSTQRHAATEGSRGVEGGRLAVVGMNQLMNR